MWLCVCFWLSPFPFPRLLSTSHTVRRRADIPGLTFCAWKQHHLRGVFSITWFLGDIWAFSWHTVYLTSWPMRSDHLKTGKDRSRGWFLLDMHIHFAINSHSAFECPRGSTMHMWMLPKEDLREICLDALAFESPRTSKPKITKLQFTLNKVKLFGIFRNYSKLCLKLHENASNI